MARDECCAREPRPLLVLGVIDCDGRDRERRGWSYELVGSDGPWVGISWHCNISNVSFFVVSIVDSDHPFISLSEKYRFTCK